jgi:hypothetical protein
MTEESGNRMYPDAHAFAPGRPGGTVCTAERVMFGGRIRVTKTLGEPCGYPAAHPIHADVPTTGETHAQYNVRRDAEQPDPVNVVRGIVAAYVPNGEESYGIAMRYLQQLEGGTPAERITGISDRRAAALADLAELRRDFGGRGVSAMFDRIEAALREGEAR